MSRARPDAVLLAQHFEAEYSRLHQKYVEATQRREDAAGGGRRLALAALRDCLREAAVALAGQVGTTSAVHGSLVSAVVAGLLDVMNESEVSRRSARVHAARDDQRWARPT